MFGECRACRETVTRCGRPFPSQEKSGEIAGNHAHRALDIFGELLRIHAPRGRYLFFPLPCDARCPEELELESEIRGAPFRNCFRDPWEKPRAHRSKRRALWPNPPGLEILRRRAVQTFDAAFLRPTARP